MTAWLIRLFVPNRDQVSNPQVRAAYGTLAAVTGIIVNVLLAAGKFLIGLISGAMIGFLSQLWIIGWIFSLIGAVAELYVLVGVILTVLSFTQVLK